MKIPRAAAYLLLMTAIACVGARTARADGLEGAHDAAGAPFDNNGGLPGSGGAPVITPGSNSAAAQLANAAPAAPHSSGIPVPAFVKDTADAVSGNWKPLLAGAAVGGFVGAGIGSVIPGAGTLAGGLIGAVLGAGLGLMFSGDAKGADMGKTLSGAGAGALVGMAFGSAVPVIGTILGAIGGALIGGALTHFFF